MPGECCAALESLHQCANVAHNNSCQAASHCNTSSRCCRAAELPPLPILETRGNRPEWDDYLLAVYGGTVEYPVDLRNFQWFYRCGCSFVTPSCTVSHTACSTTLSLLEGFRRVQPGLSRSAPYPAHHGSSCGNGMQVPLKVTPKVWLSSFPLARSQAAHQGVEAFVAGPPYADPSAPIPQKTPNRSRVQPWASPEFWLAPFGWWAFPLPFPDCNPSFSWVEVLRVAQPTERRWRTTFYFHAKGSGVWLNLGRTVCCRSPLILDADLIGSEYGYRYIPLPQSKGFNVSKGRAACKNDGSQPPTARRGARDEQLTYDTIQRRGVGANLLEVACMQSHVHRMCRTRSTLPSMHAPCILICR